MKLRSREDQQQSEIFHLLHIYTTKKGTQSHLGKERRHNNRDSDEYTNEIAHYRPNLPPRSKQSCTRSALGGAPRLQITSPNGVVVRHLTEDVREAVLDGRDGVGQGLLGLFVYVLPSLLLDFLPAGGTGWKDDDYQQQSVRHTTARRAEEGGTPLM